MLKKWWFWMFGKKEEKPADNPEITNPRYKLVQNVVSKKWAVWDTRRSKYADLVSENGYWWGETSLCFYRCWAESRDVAEAAFECICETGKIWK